MIPSAVLTDKVQREMLPAAPVKGRQRASAPNPSASLFVSNRSLGPEFSLAATMFAAAYINTGLAAIFFTPFPGA